MSNIIEVKNLVKNYKDVHAVNDISFTVEEGSFFAFLGINGAGKSTTINILCTVLEKTSGNVKIGGYDLDKEKNKIKELIGIVFQGSVLDKQLTVKENLGYDDFLKLLSAEMQYQDPLEPTSNTDYVAQMATFSQLEATLSMKESMSSSYDQTTKSAALSLVGKEVIVTDKDSASGYYSGKVDYVTYKDGKIQLSINEKMYDYSSLYSVSTDEYYDAIVNSSTFSGLIAKLPKIEDLTIDSKGIIEEARKLYDGLSDYGKQFINASDYSKLQAYEDKLKELIAADKNNQADSKENDTNQTA